MERRKEKREGGKEERKQEVKKVRGSQAESKEFHESEKKKQSLKQRVKEEGEKRSFRLAHLNKIRFPTGSHSSDSIYHLHLRLPLSTESQSLDVHEHQNHYKPNARDQCTEFH